MKMLYFKPLKKEMLYFKHSFFFFFIFKTLNLHVIKPFQFHQTFEVKIHLKYLTILVRKKII